MRSVLCLSATVLKASKRLLPGGHQHQEEGCFTLSSVLGPQSPSRPTHVPHHRQPSNTTPAFGANTPQAETIDRSAVVAVKGRRSNVSGGTRVQRSITAEDRSTSAASVGSRLATTISPTDLASSSPFVDLCSSTTTGYAVRPFRAGCAAPDSWWNPLPTSYKPAMEMLHARPPDQSAVDNYGRTRTLRNSNDPRQLQPSVLF